MSFPRYPRYKQSGVEWLGEVPEHWSVSRVKNLFNLMSRPPEAGDDIVTAFRDGVVTRRSNRRVDGFTNAVHEHGYQRVLKGDLVIHAMDAFAGAIGVSDSDGKSTPVYSVCTPKNSYVNACYYARLMRHMALSGYIQSLSKGIRERSTEFRWNEASNVDVAVPRIEEQNAIVAFLDRETTKIDALIAEQQRLMGLLKEKRQAVIADAVTRGLNPKARMKDSGLEWLGYVPEQWQVTKLKHLYSKIEQGWSPQCESVPAEFDQEWGVLKVGCVNGGKFDPAENKRLPEELEPIPSLGVRKDDLLISRANSRELVGSAAVVERDYPTLMLCDKLYRILFDARTCPQFVSYYLGSGPIREQIELEATGASDSMLNIAQSTILDLSLALPRFDEQKNIVAFLSDELAKLDSLLTEAQTAINLLQERRTALISAAVTGQIDVRKFVL